MAGFGKKKAPVDPLEQAGQTRNLALGVFNRAARDLQTANEQYEEVKATEAARIADAQARHEAAVTGQGKNDRIISKLNDLLGTE